MPYRSHTQLGSYTSLPNLFLFVFDNHFIFSTQYFCPDFSRTQPWTPTAHAVSFLKTAKLIIARINKPLHKKILMTYTQLFLNQNTNSIQHNYSEIFNIFTIHCFESNFQWKNITPTISFAMVNV